jgi:hypothetical protein
LESSKRAQQLIGQVLEILRELSYETQRQDKSIAALQERLAALEQQAGRGQGAAGAEPHTAPGPEEGD